ncbi:START-like domain-containing protein [Xylanibacter rodentium]|uniref:START-like domain-containing protein n=1 Tax=Xylanibacter rodentium TaxID=2736289 RepID=UPI0015532C0C|nr:START-like domain-containing protein [Xylanibacter rodentium]NPE12304.1 hypothetical protein [Prevotella sp. PJ1A]NPE37818.1 hypothetical protein [Prevotella sp. PCJ2]
MDKHKIVLEYPLQTKSENIVWQLIGTAEGLGKWIADYVTRDGDTMTFTWGEVWTHNDTKVALILDIQPNRYIRMKWDYIEHEDAYWEIRIEKSDFTGHLTLIITDFADDGDKDYLQNLWNDNMKRLHEISGF